MGFFHKPSVKAGQGGKLFVYPAWSPPATLGLQFMDWGEGGPSGDMTVKQTTPISAAYVIGFCGQPLVQSYMNILPMGQGIPRTRPASPQVDFGQAANATPLTYIRGMMKAPGN